ncbi:hypothetical protein MNEG_11693 [Monoraphidium neglectum]|uniref:Uncharacterized protein n=1 Tax=Monoraphidium neglectum TaxID=145388 RepID=A0A0D2KKD6_9CHLO|nr:hypothetical protein MNEG_11693 [Monoraphidium neglectum]KIY96268.1 hypothetical protein MNEG_11693 [Monoraphidium neglectum]|eukprot:XP_013895288.1 hypothetical protein MNEG_11693 [Monoraphidium neglectum]
MPPKGTKRKAAASSGSGGSGAGGAKVAKGRSAKGKPPGNPPKASPPIKDIKPETLPAGTSGGCSGAPGATVYAVKCSRATRVALISKEAYTDLYGDEVTDMEELINTKAVRMDGTWFWSGPGSCAPNKGPAPGLVVYRTTAAANAASEEAWEELMRGHPFDCRVAGNEDKLEKDEDEDRHKDEDEDQDADEDTGTGTGGRSQQKRAASSDDDGGSDADPDDFKTMAPGGLAAWARRERFLYCPYNAGTPNIMSSKARVEIIEVVVK